MCRANSSKYKKIIYYKIEIETSKLNHRNFCTIRSIVLSLPILIKIGENSSKYKRIIYYKIEIRKNKGTMFSYYLCQSI